MDEIIGNMREFTAEAQREEMTIEEKEFTGKGWTIYQGDNVKTIRRIADNSVGLIVSSPPFPGMYVYTNSSADMGNVTSLSEMINHFKFLIPELFRVTQPGRSCCLHMCQAVAFKGTDGYIGIKDFRGKLIEAMEEGGWIYYGEACINKNPQTVAVRTKDAGLLFKSLATDSARMHMALADYLLQFRKPGENSHPIRAGQSEKYHNPNGWISQEEWIEWAAPVWYRQTDRYPGGIKETEVLSVAEAREEKDERHLAPLQLGVCERAIKLWSNPGDLVYDPFSGSGSVGYKALLLHRTYIGTELKPSYVTLSLRNLQLAEKESTITKLPGFEGK